MAEEIACIYPQSPILLDITKINSIKVIKLKVCNKTKKYMLYYAGFNPINNIFKIKNKLSIIKPLSNCIIELSLLNKYSPQHQINTISFNLIFKFYLIIDSNLVKLEINQLFKNLSAKKENQKTTINLLFKKNEGNIKKTDTANKIAKNYNSLKKSLTDANTKLQKEIEQNKKIINNVQKKENNSYNNKFFVYILFSLIGLLIGISIAVLFKKFRKNRNKKINNNNENEEDYNVTFLTMEEVGEIKNITQQSNELYKNIYKVNIFEEVQKEKKIKEDLAKKKNKGEIIKNNWLLLIFIIVFYCFNF